LLRTPSDQVAVVAVLNGHFLCQFVRIALIIGRGKPTLYFDTPTKNGELQPEVIGALSANAAIAMIHVVMPTAEHCDSEERVTCESG
jgi:predicted aconitase